VPIPAGRRQRLCRDLSGIQDGQLSRIAQRLRAEFPFRQASEQPVPPIGLRDDQHAVAAPQACFDECERRLGERVATTILAFGMAVKLGEMAAGRRVSQQVATSARGHSLHRFIVVVTCALEHRGARRGQVALDPQHRPLPAGEALLATVTPPRESDHLRERNTEHVLAGGVQRDAKPLVFRGAEDVGVGAADLLEGPV